MTTSPKTWRIALAAGGTGGHVYPAMAVLQALLERKPPPEIYFLGRKSGLERRLVESLPVKYIGLSVAGIPRRLSLRWITSPLLALGAFLRSVWMFLGRRPQLVIGFGSYVAAPVVLAALCLGIPTIIHEQNAVPGIVNRVLAPFATRTLLSVEDTARLLPRANSRVVGIPLRREILHAPAEPHSLGLEPGRNTLLLFGGSQGARRLCQVAAEAMPRLESDLADWQTLFITGPNNYEEVCSKPLPPKVIVKDYVEAMGTAYTSASLVIARAGAVSLAEITAAGLPAILIPLPIATGGHQAKNAEILQRQGAAVVIEDARLTPDTLAEAVRALVRDPERRRSMAASSKALGRPGATQTFLKEIDSVCRPC
ncbi:MAG TPA: undecaprenyldiphospho-muramoylpentapeptide beta-N-acetylglucosaminyltransferase [Firmicutes bacterium]|nr:undecaprenyldiphospho-muramoylpentapeptide beta-N-acetylglucosaminyltransferase [Bacillota bacterium]